MFLYLASISALTAIIVVQSIIFYLSHKTYQRMIDSLTNKLMVRQGHREYREQPPVEEEKPKRKPMSFYDDPDIEDEAVS